MSVFRNKAVDARSFGFTEPPKAKTGGFEGKLSEAYHRDLERARQALAGLGRRLHRTARLASRSGEAHTIPSSELVARLQMSVKKEHDFVLWPLLDRLDAFATRLMREEDVPFEIIEEGLALMNRYLGELHDVHLHLLQIAEIDPKKGEASRLAFGQLVSDFEQARVRWATVLVMLRGYEAGVAGYRALLGLTLAQECRSERAWHDFEEDYVRSSVPSEFSSKVAEKWQAELNQVRESGRADRTRVADFEKRTTAYGP
jgi:hypothetical protein